MLAGLSRQSAFRQLLCGRRSISTDTATRSLLLLPLVAVVLAPAGLAHVVHPGELRSDLTPLTHSRLLSVQKGRLT